VSDPKNWKKQYEELFALLQEKEQRLQEYQKAIQQSNQLMKEVMDKLAMELKMAHQIHRILLPADLPVISNCEFSFKFQAADIDGQGKDFYEVIPHLRRKSFSITMSSCTSHSLSALLFSARLKMMGRGDRIEQLKPHEFICRLMEGINEDISNMSQKGIKPLNPLKNKIDLFYSFIDQRTYNMSYCLIGDIVVLLYCAKTGGIDLLNTANHSLDKNSLAELKTEVLSLNAKDRLVVCSPGVLSSVNPEGDSFPLSRLQEVLKEESSNTVHELRNKIIYELKSFSNNTPSKRDQSVLVMDIKSNILKVF